MNDTPNENPLAVFSDDALIKAFRDFRDVELARLTAEYEAQIKPIRDRIETIRSEMHRRLLERGGGSLKAHATTDSGTAYLSSKLSATCHDRNAYLKFCVENFDAWGSGLLTAHVTKETVEQYIASTKDDAHPNGVPPPGVTVSTIITCNIRK